MGMRPGRAKGPYVGPVSGGGGGGSYPPVSPNITPAWFSAGTFTHAQFQAAALTNTLALYALPAKGVLHGIEVIPTVQFAGTGMTSYQVSCGLLGDLERYTSLLDVLNIAPANNVSQLIPLFYKENRAAITTLRISATSNVNLSNSTAGSLSVNLLLAISP